MKTNCEVVRAEVRTLLAIPVGAFNFNKPCSNQAVYSLTPTKGSRLIRPMKMCQGCYDECLRELGKDAFTVERI